MYRIRFHGRGGQGMKTASRVLGTSFFHSGFVVQDAPRYGAERRGAPIFAYVRADDSEIRERSEIQNPGLVAVADDTLFQIAAPAILRGITSKTILIINSIAEAETWRSRIDVDCQVINLPHPPGKRDDLHMAGVMLAAAVAALAGVIPEPALLRAIDEETAYLGPMLAQANKTASLFVYQALAPKAGLFQPGERTSVAGEAAPRWIDIKRDDVFLSAPDIHGASAGGSVHTGLWRTVRPVFHEDLCHGCTWICGTLCPDSAISMVQTKAGRRPVIDYDHCKGCLICSTICPNHALEAVAEAGSGVSP